MIRCVPYAFSCTSLVLLHHTSLPSDYLRSTLPVVMQPWVPLLGRGGSHWRCRSPLLVSLRIVSYYVAHLSTMVAGNIRAHCSTDIHHMGDPGIWNIATSDFTSSLLSPLLHLEVVCCFSLQQQLLSLLCAPSAWPILRYEWSVHPSP